MDRLPIMPARDVYNPAPTADPPWWETAVIYQIYPRSFQDSTGDGVGDLPGIRQRLPYLRDLGVDAVWISPFFRSPMADFGYDIADYCDVDPVFGSMSDFDALLADAHDLGIRVIIDFVPNHTSDRHPWFVESRSSRDNPKRDWYIWRDPKPDGGPPTNLVGFFAGSAWTLDEATGQYYLHMFLEEQPDLNWRNPEVVAAMHDVLRFWLDKGVDGFRLDAITVLIKREPLSDLPGDPLSLTGRDLLLELTEIHNQPELHDILQGFRRVLDEYDGDRVLIGETNAAYFDELVEFYGSELDEIQLPMNLTTLLLPWEAQTMRRSLAEYYDALPPRAVPSIVFGNHDRSRLATRFGPENARAANALLLTLWGVPTMYYGDELDMVDGRVMSEQRQDPFFGEAHNVGSGRDPERTPMQWDDSKHAGFTGDDVAPWLPVKTTFHSSVAAQENDPASTLNFCRELLALRRRSPALQVGSLRFMNCPHDDLLVYERKADGERLLVAVNFGAASHVCDLLPIVDNAEVLLSSRTVAPAKLDSPRAPIAPHEALILRLW
jgi:alpha-glucosidase